MFFHIRTGVSLAALCVLAVGVRAAGPDTPSKRVPPETGVTPQQAHKAVERGLSFLEKDAAKWRKDRTCSTCHHGTMTVWALSEARSQGYDVKADTLADTVKWTKDRLLAKIDAPRDTRP